MKKAGATNRDKNRIRSLWKDGKTVEQISALTSVRIEHVQAIVKRLEESGQVMYTTGRSGTGAGGTDYSDGAPGEGEDISQAQAANMVNEGLQDENAALRRQLEEATARADEAESALDDETAPDETEESEEDAA